MGRANKQYWTDRGAYEVRNTRNFVTLIILVVVAAIALAWALTNNASLRTTVNDLQAHRVLYAYPSQDGGLLTSETRPPQMVTNFAKQFLYNLYNYDPQSVQANFAEALAMDNPLRLTIDSAALQNQASTVHNQQITSTFLIYEEKKPVPTASGYEYECIGRQRTWTADTPVTDQTYDIKVYLRNVPPTKERYAGLVIDHFTREAYTGSLTP